MPHIRHELLIEASPEKIYDAITTQEGLAGWWTPQVSATAGLNSTARFPFGPNYFKEMKIVELKPAAQVKWACIAGAGEWVGTTISFNLQPVTREVITERHPEVTGQMEQLKGADQWTLLQFHHDDWKNHTPMFAECNYTWALFLRSLKLLCETGRGLPWPQQHRV
ncbi:MAG TPA: SRPBCC domain-containing protein [Chitinophagaceae bacterium]|nr:SRPBCC domain-containing protein [Chitinophagaceae bacterium]